MALNIQSLIGLLSKQKDRDNEGKQLTKTVVKSSAISFVAKVITILLGLVTLPIVFNHLDRYQFGVFATLTSIISWIDLFDFGITQGLRNRLTEAKVDGNIKLAKQYISTAYALLSIIAGTVFAIYIIFYRYINWQSILNATILDRATLDSMALIVVVCFLVRFVASVINKIYFAMQKSFMVDITQLIGKVAYLVVVIVLAKTENLTLYNVAVIQSALAALVPILASMYFFTFVEKAYAPSFNSINLKISNQIFGLGLKFFVIQIALLIIHSGNNLLISQFVDPASVPSYTLSYKLFSYVLMAYTIIITPLWSAYTESWRRGDVQWIKRTMHRIRQIYLLFAIGCMLMVIMSPWIFRVWIGEKADVPMTMALAVATMILLDMWIRIYDFFINGVGKVKVQMIINICMATINIPLAYVFAVVCNMGALGVVMASIISYSISAVISPIQANMLLKGSAKGIWNK